MKALCATFESWRKEDEDDKKKAFEKKTKFTFRYLYGNCWLWGWNYDSKAKAWRERDEKNVQGNERKAKEFINSRFLSKPFLSFVDRLVVRCCLFACAKQESDINVFFRELAASKEVETKKRMAWLSQSNVGEKGGKVIWMGNDLTWSLLFSQSLN